MNRHCFSIPVANIARAERERIIANAIANYGPVVVSYYSHRKYGRMMVVHEAQTSQVSK